MQRKKHEFESQKKKTVCYLPLFNGFNNRTVPTESATSDECSDREGLTANAQTHHAILLNFVSFGHGAHAANQGAYGHSQTCVVKRQNCENVNQAQRQ
jgi:hypothetical protein